MTESSGSETNNQFQGLSADESRALLTQLGATKSNLLNKKQSQGLSLSEYEQLARLESEIRAVQNQLKQAKIPQNGSVRFVDVRKEIKPRFIRRK